MRTNPACPGTMPGQAGAMGVVQGWGAHRNAMSIRPRQVIGTVPGLSVELACRGFGNRNCLGEIAGRVGCQHGWLEENFLDVGDAGLPQP